MFVLGLLVLVGSLILLFYFRSLPPITVENYYSKEIAYSRVYYDKQRSYDGQTKSAKIVLASDEQKYNISYRIWQDYYSPETIVDGLTKSNQARIWLESPDSHEIKGIATLTFSIEPALGVEWDKNNRHWGVIVAWMFIVCGGLLIVIPLFFSSHYEKMAEVLFAEVVC